MTGYTIAGRRAFLMAGQTPSHLIGRSPGRVGRGIDKAMAIHALQAMGKMAFMREIDEIGKALKAHP
jgi:hypothetical protein